MQRLDFYKKSTVYEKIKENETGVTIQKWRFTYMVAPNITAPKSSNLLWLGVFTTKQPD